MTTIHFVYAVPNVKRKNIILYCIYRIFRFFRIPPPYRTGVSYFIDWPKPVHAPFSITFFILNSLRKKYNVKLYDLNETGNVRINENDILLMHLKPQLINGNWVGVDKNSIGYKLLVQKKNVKTYLIAPYNHDQEQIGWLKEAVSGHPDLKYITICGRHWIDTWDQSPLKDILNKNNVLQVNMCVDFGQYPFSKKKFSPKGKRKFLYIGRTTYPKNIAALEAIALRMNGFEGGYISNGEIKGWQKISNSTNLTYQLIKSLVDKYDFFLSTSEADAQATTVLEQMCIGLGIACTPESGINYSSIIKLDKDDTNFNCKQIDLMQTMDESALLAMAYENRLIVENQHNWEQICDKICKFLAETI